MRRKPFLTILPLVGSLSANRASGIILKAILSAITHKQNSWTSKAFAPYFRQQRNGTFVNVTSSFGLLGYPTCSIYSATKFGVDGFSEALLYEMAQFNVQVKIVAPGGMQTDFTGRSMQGNAHPAYAQLVEKVSAGYSAEQIANYTKAEEVAQVVFDAATDGREQFRYIAGKDAQALYKE